MANDDELNCVSHAGRHKCSGTCRTQHLKIGGTPSEIYEFVDCQYYHEVI